MTIFAPHHPVDHFFPFIEAMVNRSFTTREASEAAFQAFFVQDRPEEETFRTTGQVAALRNLTARRMNAALIAARDIGGPGCYMPLNLPANEKEIVWIKRSEASEADHKAHSAVLRMIDVAEVLRERA